MAEPGIGTGAERLVQIAGRIVPRGTREQIEVPVARLPTGNFLPLPVTVISGNKPGPSLWLDAAIHGDELNGMEIIRRLLCKLRPKGFRGNLIAVPIVNVFGFIQQERYLPDRRDLNRSFPGSPKGSLAARLAHIFMNEVVGQCDYGIDLHTGSLHRTNLPQVRADLHHPRTRRLAEAFNAPLMYHAKTLPGSLRAAATRRGIPLLVFEGGEPLRFDAEVIRVGLRGVIRVLSELGMWQPEKADEGPPIDSFEASETRWIRSSRGGIFHNATALGDRVKKGQALGMLTDPYSSKERPIKAPFSGLVLGFTRNPLVYKGDALVHLARGIVANSLPKG